MSSPSKIRHRPSPLLRADSSIARPSWAPPRSKGKKSPRCSTSATFPRLMCACSTMTNRSASSKPPATRSTSSRVCAPSNSPTWTSLSLPPTRNPRARTGNAPAMPAARSSIFPAHWKRKPARPFVPSGWSASAGRCGSRNCSRLPAWWPILRPSLWLCCFCARAKRAPSEARWPQFSSLLPNKDRKAWTSCTSKPSIFCLSSRCPKMCSMTQVAFNMVARYGQKSQLSLDSLEARVRRHYQKLAGADAPQPALMVLQPPVFHGHALAIFLEMEQPVDQEKLSQALTGDHVTLAGSEDDSQPSNVNTAGQPILWFL